MFSTKISLPWSSTGWTKSQEEAELRTQVGRWLWVTQVSSSGPCERETERDKSHRDPRMLAASFETERG